MVTGVDQGFSETPLFKRGGGADSDTPLLACEDLSFFLFFFLLFLCEDLSCLLVRSFSSKFPHTFDNSNSQGFVYPPRAVIQPDYASEHFAIKGELTP